MSDIHERLTVLCPFDQTPKAAAAFLDSLPLKDGKRVVPIRIEVGDLVVDRSVDLELEPAHTEYGHKVMNVQWAPHDGGPYPFFKGTSVEESDGNYSRLDLDGSYETPPSFAGALFDAVIGHRVALAACRQLLDEIKTGFELAFQTGMTI